MDETKTSTPSPDKPTDKDYKKKRVEEIGSTLAQIKARVKANRSCARKDDDSKSSPREILSEKSEKYIQVLQLDKAKAQKLEKERPKIKEAIESLKIDRENQKLVEKKIEETRAKQSAPLPEIPAEVQKRISDLELTVHNLKETLSEKERVLESKTESWRLLSDQLEQRNIEIVDRYEIMAREIEEMKKSYGDQETFLKQELDKCKQKLSDTDSLLISQDNERRDWEEMKGELEQLQTTHFQCETKMETERKMSLKLKAQLKKFRNEINSNKGLPEEVERLQNVIASLEEEKGNHLLQLIDFDEFKEASTRNQMRLAQLEDSVKILESELSSSVKNCEIIQQDKIALLSSLSEKEGMIVHLRQALEVMEQNKISAEFKAVELEEKLESVGSEKMSKEVDNLVCHVREQEALIEELKGVIVTREEEVRVLKEGRVDDLQDLLEEWKEKYSRVQVSVAMMEEEKLGLQSRVEELKGNLETLTSRCETFECDLKKRDTVIQQHVIKNKELVESLGRFESKQGTSKEDHTQKLKKLAANLKIKVKLCKDLEDKVTELSDKMAFQEDCLAKLSNEKNDLEALVSEYKSKLENISLDSDMVKKLQQLLNEKEAMIQHLSEQQQMLEQKALNRARTESHGEIQHLKEENLLLESRLNENLMEVHSIDEDRPSEQLLKSLTDQVEEKVNDLKKLECVVSELKAQLETADAFHADSKAALLDQARIIEELRNEIKMLKDNEHDMKSDFVNHENMALRVRDLEAELYQSKADVCTKETIICDFEQEVNSLKKEISNFESQFTKMEELYKEEASKRDETMSNIETELTTSKNEILRLCEELKEVSRNYELCMDSLGEKDKYIDILETDLKNMRASMEKLKHTIEEKQRSMEERTSKLGEKLELAASKNIGIEQNRIEMEQKLQQYQHTENQLTDMVANLQEVLAESKKSSGDKINELEMELADIKGAYNTTLDQIELLNEELKQVMAQIEHRNRELVSVGEERNRLIERLRELEDTCSNMQGQLQGYEEQSVGLRTELDSKLKELDTATAEITSLQSQLGTGSLQSDLNKELEVLKMEYEEKLRELQVEKNDLPKVFKDNDEPGLDSVEQAADLNMEEHQQAERKVEKQEDIKLFSWESHTEETSDPIVDTDDGWGWSANEARLEEEHLNSGNNRIQALESDMRKITEVKEKLEEEVKLLKVKCAKLVGKLKELKTQGERKAATGFEDLNFAMQEEMRSQVDELDNKNKELSSEISGLRGERERLVKRVETLTSANSQLIEMKERQDIEVQVWQRNCAELKSQLKSFDWNWSSQENKPHAENVVTSESQLSKASSELEDKLNFLETENEELLQIICSLKDEKQLSNNMAIELNSLKEENAVLKEAVKGSERSEEIQQLKQTIESEKHDKINLVGQITEEKNNLESKVEDLLKQLQLNQEQYKILEAQNIDRTDTKQELQALTDDLQKKIEEISTLNENIECLRDTIRELSNENEAMKAKGLERDKENEILKDQLSKLDDALKQIDCLQNMQSQLSSEIDRQITIVQTLTSENQELKSSYETKLTELELLRADMKMTEASKDSALADLQEMKILLEKMKSEKLQQSTNTPSASIMFDKSKEVFPPPSASANIFSAFNKVFSSSNTSKDHSSDDNFGGSRLLQVEDEIISQSPPVFRGFFSDQTDAFSSVVQQQFELNQEPQVIQAAEVSQVQTLPQTEGHLVEIENLKEKITLLEQENSSLIQQLSESQRMLSSDSGELSRKLTESENEIESLKNKITVLNEEIRCMSATFESEKVNLVRANQELDKKNRDYDKSIEFEKNEVNRLKCRIDELIKNEANLTEASDGLQDLRREMDERLRQSELNYQNILLSKDEENAHLVCELSASRASYEKLTLQVEALNGLVANAEKELNISREQNKSLSQEVDLLKQNVDKLLFDNSELNKIKEHQLQHFSAQVEYLQLSIQEKDVIIERLNTNNSELTLQMNSLHEQIRVVGDRANYLENCYSSVSTAHNESNAECTALKERLITTTNEFQQLNESVASMSEELVHHRSTSESFQVKESDFIHQIELLQSAITEKDLEIERLSQLLTAVQEKLIKSQESKLSDDMINLSGRLDKALYTLHLRDVRCDELTVEIMQLLEERDSLQLRLSDALRANESMKSSTNQIHSQPISPSTIQSPSSQDLNNKIGELHTGYMKDPTVKMDLQNRYSQQMHLFTSDDTSSGQSVIDGSKKQEVPGSDYGIFNWFFSSGTSPQPSLDPTT